VNPAFMDELDYLVNLAGSRGIYSVIDWHGDGPSDPYAPGLGAYSHEKKSGAPGSPLAWLAPDLKTKKDFDFSLPKYRDALVAADRWIAGHFRNNPNILGMEIPFNEPHGGDLAAENDWRQAAEMCARAILEGDPKRLTFTMAPAYSHNNYMPSVTWLPMDIATGASPHFYLANGPVPLREGREKFKHPWLARDPAATFSYGQAAVLLPLSAVGYPIYNGESGEHGFEDLLPDVAPAEAADRMIEAQFAQGWAGGLSGVLLWTLWENTKVFDPFEEVYKKELTRFQPLFAEGPLDLSTAPVGIVQDPYAIPTVDGHNFACVPLARLVLDLHLTANYLTDEQWIYRFSHEVSTGLEQVDESASNVPYKALIVDTRSLNQQALDLIKKTNLPVLFTDDADKLSADEVTAFLTKAGVAVDTRTPSDIQIAASSSHVLIYKRAGDPGEETVYPSVPREGSFRLMDEQNQNLFTGTAEDLAQNGLKVNPGLWHAMILTVVDSGSPAQGH
jgi:hypothetical protein